MPRNLVGTTKAAEILGVSISTVYRMVDQGILTPSKTPGGQRRFDMEELHSFLEASKKIVAPQNPYLSKQTTMRLTIDDGILPGNLIEDNSPDEEATRPLDGTIEKTV